MKKRNLYPSPTRLLLSAVASILTLLLMPGCETDSADNVELKISPNYAEIHRLQSISLTASGWNDYRWRLDPATANIGTLSATTGDTVVYTAIKSPTPANTNEAPPEMVQVITVRAVTQTSDETNANLSGQARIRHLPNP